MRNSLVFPCLFNLTVPVLRDTVDPHPCMGCTINRQGKQLTSRNPISTVKDNTEALIMAAQEQNLIARSIEAGVYHSHQGTSCKLCKGARRLSKTQHQEVRCKLGLLFYGWCMRTRSPQFPMGVLTFISHIDQIFYQDVFCNPPSLGYRRKLLIQMI